MLRVLERLSVVVSLSASIVSTCSVLFIHVSCDAAYSGSGSRFSYPSNGEGYVYANWSVIAQRMLFFRCSFKTTNNRRNNKRSKFLSSREMYGCLSKYMSEVVQSKDSEPTTPAIIDNLLLVITNQITINLFKCCFYYQINI